MGIAAEPALDVGLLAATPGYVRAEGAIALVLSCSGFTHMDYLTEPLCSIESVMIGHNVLKREASISTPSGDSQFSMYPDTWEFPFVDLELHATGTLAGDAIEFETAERWSIQTNTQLTVHRSKSVFGHLEGTSALLSILSSIAIAKTRQPFTRKALVNAFGFGGSIAQARLCLPASPSRKPVNYVLVVPGQGSVSPGFLFKVFHSSELAKYTLKLLWKIAADECQAYEVGVDSGMIEDLSLDPNFKFPARQPQKIVLEQLAALCFSLMSVSIWRHAAPRGQTVVLGHSMGQIAAAHFAGALTLNGCMRIVLKRLKHTLNGEDSELLDSGMAAVAAGAVAVDACSLNGRRVRIVKSVLPVLILHCIALLLVV
jgi:hypothetical protein